MRYSIAVWVVGCVLVLSGCHHSDSTTTTTEAATDSIGGTVAGLDGTLVLQNNGGDDLTLSSDGSFEFSVALQPGATYDVTIETQPSDQTCTVTDGSGTATTSVTTVLIECSLGLDAKDLWTWVAGSEHANAAGVYGTLGTAASSNAPGARRQAMSWTDSSGNFWLFGGDSAGNVAMLNDLWEYNLSTAQWTWQSGASSTGAAASYGTQGVAASSNTPGAREGGAAWADSSGNLWLFGGDSLSSGSSQDFNDLWRYSASTGQWTWIGGSSTAADAGSYGSIGVAAAGNLPPARTDAITWVDSSGVFWLFGGAQLNADGSYLEMFNDLWSYNPTSGLWTWVAGSSSPNATGVYGTLGSGATTNIPGARMGGNAWLDSSGNVWLFGGAVLGTNSTVQEHNDLWEYSPSSGQWTWVAGASSTNAAGLYGTQRATGAGNTPGARDSAVSWLDSSGNLWLFGGHGHDQAGSVGNLNDLWKFDRTLGVWIWISGASTVSAEGTYGVQGVPALASTPGAREQATGWLDSSGHFWLFGGFGFDSTGVEDDLSDLWRFNLTF